MELMKRKDVPVELTWDLSALYQDEAQWKAAVEKLREHPRLPGPVPDMEGDRRLGGQLFRPGVGGGLHRRGPARAGRSHGASGGPDVQPPELHRE